MKLKKYISLILALMLVFCLSACGGKDTPTGNEKQETKDDVIDDVPDAGSSEIKQPVLNWFMIDDFETGLPRLVMEFSNPNSVAIDFNLDVTFLKGGENKGVGEEIYEICSPAKEKCIVWYNWEIPDADSIEVKYTYVGASLYTPLNCTYQEVAKSDSSVTLKFTPDSSFQQCVVNVIGTLNGERTTHMFYDFYDMDTAEFCFESWRNFDSYEVYINCY